MTINIHIGNFKSGSTFLQKKIFPKLKNIQYLSYYNNQKIFKEIGYVQTVGNLFFDKKKIYQLKKLNYKKKKILISSEIFSGSLNTQTIGTGILIEIIAKRIKEIFKNPKIILILRNQKNSIISSYKDDIAFGHTASFDDWFKERQKINALNYFNYSKTIKFYQRIFGANNLNVFFYENLFTKKGLLDFADRMKFHLDEKDINLDLKENRSYSDLTILLSRLFNKIFQTKLTFGAGNGYYKKLFFYNLWRYKISTVFKYLDIINFDYTKNRSFLKSLKSFHKDNIKLKKLLNKNLPKEYNFDGL